jgi:hypothetical protein
MAPLSDLGCTGVDLEKFRADNRAPVFRNQWNRWILMRTTRDNPSDRDAETTLRAAFHKWNAGDVQWGPLDVVIETPIPDGPRKGTPSVRVGNCDYLHVNRVSQAQLFFPREEWARLLPANKLPARRESCDPVPTLSTPKALFIEASFVWRGSAESVPWPVLSESVFRPAQACIHGADWILDSCALPPSVEPAPTELTATQKGVDVALPSLGLGAGLVALGAVATLAALAYLRR